MDEVVSPVLHTYEYGALPPEGVAIKITALSEQITGLEDDMFTLKIQESPYP
jgi:hypothetical protein